MIADVTQNLIVRVVPVNNPREVNQYGEQQGYYNAYVATENYEIEMAQREWMRGIVHSGAGCGSHSTALYAIERAVQDYIAKFGALCVTDTEAVA